MQSTKHLPDYDFKGQILGYNPYPGWNSMEIYRIMRRLDYTFHSRLKPSPSLVRDITALCYGTKTKCPVFVNLSPDQVFLRPGDVISWFCDEYNPLLPEMFRINCADHERRKRLNKRVADILMCGDDPCFITFTFNDKTLAKCKPETLRQYVFRYLKKHCNLYVANIDFGAENGRIHYHAVCDCNPGSEWDTVLHYGFISVEKIRIDETATVERLSRYVSKLTNHAIKETTKRCALIYSR